MEELEKLSLRDKESFKRHYEKINRAFEKLNEDRRDRTNAVHPYRSRVYYLTNKFE